MCPPPHGSGEAAPRAICFEVAGTLHHQRRAQLKTPQVCRGMTFTTKVAHALGHDAGASLSDAMSTAYAEVLQPYHGWLTTTAFRVRRARFLSEQLDEMGACMTRSCINSELRLALARRGFGCPREPTPHHAA